MITRASCSFAKLATFPRMGFCAKAKSYRMPERKQLEFYKTEFPLRLHNYKVLLYANKQGLTTPMKLQSPFLTAFCTGIYLMRHNPWYLTFPASLPIMLGLQIFIFLRWMSHKRHYKYVVERVYLNIDNTVEFVFSNKIRRRLKDIEEAHSFNTPEELVTPPTSGTTGQFEWSQSGTKFPTELAFYKEANGQISYNRPKSPAFYGWTKVCENYQNYIFPKNYEYANWEILVPLMQGRFMDFQESTNEIHELPAAHDNHDLDVQLEWVRRDVEHDEQLRKIRLASTEK